MSAALGKEGSDSLSTGPVKFRSKIILRNLPPDATEAQVKQLLQPWSEREQVNYFCLHAGRASKRLGGRPARKAYALVSFAYPEALIEFVKMVIIGEDGTGQSLVLTDACGQEYLPSVEFAPSQRLPDPAREPNPHAGTLETDEEFQRFVTELQAPIGEAASGTYVDGQSQVEAMLAKERQLHPWKYVKSPEALVPSTPLLEFLARSKGRGGSAKDKGATGGKTTGDDKKSKKRRKKRSKKRDAEGTDEVVAVSETGLTEAPPGTKQHRRKKRSGDRHKNVVEGVPSTEILLPSTKVTPLRILTKKPPPTEGEREETPKMSPPLSTTVQGGSVGADVGTSASDAAVSLREGKKQQLHVKKSTNVKITVKPPPSSSASIQQGEPPLPGNDGEKVNHLPSKASMDPASKSRSHRKGSRPSVEGASRATSGSKSQMVKGKMDDPSSSSSSSATSAPPASKSSKGHPRPGPRPIIRSSVGPNAGEGPEVSKIAIAETSESVVRSAPAPVPSSPPLPPTEQSNQSSAATAMTLLKPQPIVYKTIERRTGHK